MCGHDHGFVDHRSVGLRRWFGGETGGGEERGLGRRGREEGWELWFSGSHGCPEGQVRDGWVSGGGIERESHHFPSLGF